jgi:hypothetical protein
MGGEERDLVCDDLLHHRWVVDGEMVGVVGLQYGYGVAGSRQRWYGPPRGVIFSAPVPGR